MEGLIRGPFAQSLESGRKRFNTLFNLARHARPQLDGEAFKSHLLSNVAPVVDAVAERFPEKVDEVSLALYEQSLEALGLQLIGPRSRYPAVGEAWTRIIAAHPHLVAENPTRFVLAVTNALYSLSRQPGARAKDWLALMERAGRDCPSQEIFFDAGNVAAWRAGMAHYREAALGICRRLPAEITLTALGSSSVPANQIEGFLRRLSQDPWAAPAHPTRSTGLRIVARVGAFRGFGGLFLTPPKVERGNGSFLVHDRQAYYRLYADCFGAVFQRIDKETHESVRARSTEHAINSKGKVSFKNNLATFPELAGPSSHAADENTLAVTSRLSHRITLIALSG